MARSQSGELRLAGRAGKTLVMRLEDGSRRPPFYRSGHAQLGGGRRADPTRRVPRARRSALYSRTGKSSAKASQASRGARPVPDVQSSDSDTDRYYLRGVLAGVGSWNRPELIDDAQTHG